jgi:hypothetical protein
LLYLKVRLIRYSCNNRNRNFGNYWFYLGPAGNIVMVYGRENINTLAAVLSMILPLRLQVGALLIGRAVVTCIRRCLYRYSLHLMLLFRFSGNVS